MSATDPSSSKLPDTSEEKPTTSQVENESPEKGTATPEAAGTTNTTPQPRVRKKRLGVDPSLIISEDRPKRRKTPTPEPVVEDEPEVVDPKDPERATRLGLEVYQKIMDKKDSEGELMATPFIKLPNKRSFPDYYETIKHPISLEMVHEKLEAKSYQTFKEVTVDIGQIFNNAKRYNVKQSDLFQYAKKLHKLLRTFYAKATSPHGKEPTPEPDSEPEMEEPVKLAPEPSVDVEDVEMRGPSESVEGDTPASGHKRRRGAYMKDGPTVYKLIKPVLKAIKEAKARDGSGRDVAGIFMDLPDRKLFPDYYKAIQNPISLSEIEERHVGRRYESHEEFFEDLAQMCQNAFTYNEDNSEVFKDAQQIMAMLELHKQEVHRRLTQPHVPVQKFKVRGSAGTPGRPAYRPSTSAEPIQQGYPQTAYASPSPYPQATHLPQQSPATAIPPQPPVPYLPALPPGVVTEEIVSSLEKYPLYEQQAWAQTLPPLAMQIYRQMLSANEHRKRMALNHPSSHPPLPDLPSSARPGGVPTVPNRQAPPQPTIRCIDFTYGPTPTYGNGKPPGLRHAIRLHNMKGVVNHAVIIGAQTSEIEITAYVDDPPTPSSTTNGEVSPAALNSAPEASLRINGNQGNLPTFVFSGTQRDRPAGMRWTISVPTNKMDTKLEVVTSKPGSLAETSCIFIQRQ